MFGLKNVSINGILGLFTATVVVIGAAGFLLGVFLLGVYAGENIAREKYAVSLAVAMAQQQPLAAAVTLPPNELGAHRWVGRMDARLGGLDIHFLRYSMLDATHDNREWGSMACVDAGRGLEVGGRWDPDGWWIAAHDADHPYPESIRVPVKNIPDEPVRPVGVR